MRSIAAAVLLASQSILALARPASASVAESPPLDRLVVAGTPLFVSFPNPGASVRRFRELPLYKTWADPEVQEFLKSARTFAPRLLAENAGPAVARVYELLSDFPSVFDREISVAWLDRDDPFGRWVAVVEGSDEKRVRDLSEAFERSVFDVLFASAPARSEHAGTSIRTYGSGFLEVAIANRGGRVIVGSPRREVEALLDAHATPPASPLASDSAYRALRERLGADGGEMFFATIDAGGLARRALEGKRDEDRRVAEATGLLSLGRAGAVVRPEDGGLLRERIAFEFPDGRRGLFAAVSENENRAGVARLAPSESLGAFAINLKLRDLYATILDIERASEGRFRVGSSNLDSAVEKEIRLRLMGDFVELLGEEVGAYVALPTGGGMIPEAGLFVEVRDAERFRMNLEELAAKTLKLDFRTTEFRGRKVHWLEPERRGGFGLTFSYAVADPFLVVSYFPLNVKNALARLDLASGTLSGDAAFASALAALPADRRGFFFADTKRTVAYLYNLLSFLMQMDVMSDLPFDPAALPTVEALTRHLSRTTGAVSASSRAIVADVRSEGIGPASLLMYGSLAGGLFSPMLVARSIREAESTCQHNLHRFEWSTRTDPEAGVVPGLRRVFAERPEDLRFDCPADVAGRGEGGGPVLSYVLAFPGEGDRPPDLPPREVIVAFERAPHHRGGRYVLRLDASVEWLAEDEFARRLARQAAAAASR